MKHVKAILVIALVRATDALGKVLARSTSRKGFWISDVKTHLKVKSKGAKAGPAYEVHDKVYWRDPAEQCYESPIYLSFDVALRSQGNSRDVILNYEQYFPKIQLKHSGPIVKLSPLSHEGKQQPWGYMTLDGKTYSAVQLHIHSEAEHAFHAFNPQFISKQHQCDPPHHYSGLFEQNESFPRRDFEVHTVHETILDTGEKRLAVLAVTLTESESALCNPFVESILGISYDASTKDSVVHSNRGWNVTDLFPPTLCEFGRAEFFRYLGSSTTAPITEKVQWVVATNAVLISKMQSEGLQGFLSRNGMPKEKSLLRNMKGYNRNTSPVHLVQGLSLGHHGTNSLGLSSVHHY